MKRREALKNIGLSFGYTAVAPTVFNLLQSCTTNSNSWTPKFISVNQGIVVVNLIDIILPKTASSPGALEVNVPEFIDLIALKVYKPKAQSNFKDALNAITSELMAHKEDEFTVADLKFSDYDALLSKYLKSTPEQRNAFNEMEYTVHKGLVDLRAKAIWAYKNTEQVGENVLAYNPIPGYYENCVDLNKTTNGKGWSLQS